MYKVIIQLLPVITFFILSLVGAFVLFKLLKSTAIIKKAGYQAGGALAGFLLIFGALYYSYSGQMKCEDRLKEAERACEHESWTIVGTVKRVDATRHEGIIVREIPPTSSTSTDPSGFFLLRDIKMMKQEGWPRLFFETKGYNPVPFQINEINANINAIKKEIELKDDLELSVIE